MKRALLSIILALGFGLLPAQEGFLRHYSIGDGLPSSETYSAFQDSKGYIWIASDMGVSRFDGYNFKVFTTADGLTDNTVFKFFEDHYGRIWFYTFSGRLSYYFHDSIYGKDFAVNEQIRSFLGSDFIKNIRVDPADTIWLATTRGLLKMAPTFKNGFPV
jgi:ligand-binding sensor domain-containing protein